MQLHIYDYNKTKHVPFVAEIFFYPKYITSFTIAVQLTICLYFT